MRTYLPFIIIGLTSGSIYALAAMGLVVTYTTSGVFNFAHGAIAMISAYAFYSLRVSAGIPTALAAAIVVLLFGPLIGIVIDRLLFRRLAGAPSSVYVVVSLGLLVLLQGIAIEIYGPITRPFASLFPRSTFRLPGVRVGWDQLITVLIAAALGLVLVAFFRRNHLGLEMRAVVDDPSLTELSGSNSARVTTLSWVLGCAFAALSGVLLAPILGIDATVLILLVVYSFGAAAVGRLVSLPLAYAGAIGIGIVGGLSTKFIDRHPSLAGLPTSLPFLVLFIVLVVSPKGSFTEVTKTVQAAGTSVRRLRTSRRFPIRVLLFTVLGAVLLPTFLSSGKLTTATETAVFVLIFSSLGLLVGLSRQVALCQAVFVAFGATSLSHLQHAGVPYLPALALAGLFVVPAAALLAIPAIRLSGLFLALATFGFGVLAEDLLFGTGVSFGGRSVVSFSRPQLFGISLNGQTAFYFFVLSVVVIGVVAVETVRTTRLGRLLRAMADSPTAIESIGINPTASRVVIFCLSGFLAAIAGGLLGTLTQTANPSSFGFFQSLLWVAVLVMAGSQTFGGALLSAVLLIALPSFFTSSAVINHQTVAFGLGAILLAQAPNGLVGFLHMPDFAELARSSSWRLSDARARERVTALRGEAVS